MDTAGYLGEDQSAPPEDMNTELMGDITSNASAARAALMKARQRLMAATSVSPQEQSADTAAAWLAPTRTGNFGDTLANVARNRAEQLAQSRELGQVGAQQDIGLQEKLSGIDQGVLGSKLRLAQMAQEQQLARQKLAAEAPQIAARLKEEEADTALKDAERENPGKFHPNNQAIPADAQMAIASFIKANPNLAGNLRSLTSNGGWGVAYALATGHEYGAAPATSGTTGGSTPPQGGYTGPGGSKPETAPNGVVVPPGVSLAEQAAIRKDFASGTSNKQTGSLNTMIQHANLFDQIADQLNNGNVVPTNAIKNEWARLFGGSPVPSNLGIAAQFLGNEAIKATVNSGAGTADERALKVGPNANPASLHGAAETLRKLATGQLNTLKLRATRGGVDIGTLLGPEARTAFGLDKGAQNPAAVDMAALARAELARRQAAGSP
jgi:hypothetical protein